jgi:hypothetical protein
LNLLVAACGSKTDVGAHHAPAMFEVVLGGKSFA